MQYKVTKIYGRGSESALVEFTKEQEAIHFIQEKLAEDKRFKVNASYRLYDFTDLLKEFTSADLSETSSESAGQPGAGSSQTFSPTPFNTAPRPGSMPHSWVKDKDKEDKDKEA